MLSDEAKLIDLISTKFKANAASIGLNEDFFVKLGINSLQALDLLSQIEIEFDVNIPDEKLKAIKTIQNLLDIIRE